MDSPSFDWGNEILYKMCRESPRHEDTSVVVGKIWLIGRSYSAAIERKAGSKMVKGENFYLTQVGPTIKESDIDKWIASVSSITRVTENTLEPILSCHKNVTDLFSKISGIEKRSLASKYLHFHAPNAFFIYDSIASKNLTKLQKTVKSKGNSGIKDSSYASFCYRCLALRKTLEKKWERQITPRELDIYLLSQ